MRIPNLGRRQSGRLGSWWPKRTSGAIASEPFQEAETRYRALLGRRRQGELDARGFRAGVRALTVQDGDGRDWVLGPEDGNWYRRDRDRWVSAQPPRRLLCPHCGHRNLTRHSFCVECGGRLIRLEHAD